MLEELVPEIHQRWPDLTHQHRFAILTVAPRLVDIVGAVPTTLQMAAPAEERTRFQSGLARRASQGITELLSAYARHRGPLSVTFDAVHAADPTDQEFLAILLRRSDPELVRVGVGTTARKLPVELAAALEAYAAQVVTPRGERQDDRSDDDLLRAFVASAGTSDDPDERGAWERADPDLRAGLHDEAAAGTSGLGALVYHRLHGSDPSGAGVEAVESAVRHCLGHGFFPAAAEFARLGLELVTQPR